MASFIDTIPSTSTFPDSTNYDYFYFPRLYLLLVHKKSVNVISSINTGATCESNNYADYIGY